MRPARRATTHVALTAVAALTLAGCAADTSLESAGSQAPGATTPVSASPAASVVPPATSSPVPEGPLTFTFADARLSIAHPEGWRVEHEQVSTSPAVETATVYDADGKEQINIYYSQVGDVTAGNVSRTIIETDPVPGLIGASVPTPSSSFFIDRADGVTHYRMGLTPGLPVSPDGQVQYGLVKLGDRILTADVLFTEPRFTGDEAAQAWYWSDEGRALKSVLMSFSYR
ncbi:hypothetical protein [Pseudarthrobacter sp. NamE5]|uniref:hypothetical protein n=1 Tax=Pseudarthrobacter sp. NamE5 TaxID=2576839 RepID=UPI00110A728B|nr:hypothetical protein [Pseudarthrobacter sp. NamE5]TLM84307.1 hypothetical protein FDW84_12220 [Pseudarthrobacter sp. NamE5]